MRWGMIASLIGLAWAGPAGAQEVLPKPYVGAWADGGVATCSSPFRFGATLYTPPGDRPARIRRVQRVPGGYRVTTAANYAFQVSDIRGDALQWTSLASGDSFRLRRCR